MENVTSFWKRPEGKVGTPIFLAACALGLWAVGPFLLGLLWTAISLVGSTIVLGGLLAVLAGMIFLATNSTFQTFCGIAFKMSMRKLTNVLIMIEPIEVMRASIKKFQSLLSKMDQRLNDLNGVIRDTQRVINQQKSESTQALQTAKIAKDQGKTAAFTLNARKSERREKSSIRLEDALMKMQFLQRALMKYREVSEVAIADMTDEANVQEKERKAIMASYSAMSAARSIMNGQGDAREMFDRALEYTNMNNQMKLGEIENFMTMSQSFMEGFDLQNGVMEQSALDKIAEWEKKADSLLLGDLSHVANVSTPKIVQRTSSYSSLLNKA